MVLVQNPWSRQDLINKVNLFHSVPVEKMKTVLSIIYVTTTNHTELSWICIIYTHLQAEVKRNAAKMSVGKCFQERYQLIHNMLYHPYIYLIHGALIAQSNKDTCNFLTQSLKTYIRTN